MASRELPWRAENEAGQEESYSRSDDYKLGVYLQDGSGDGRRSNHPSHDTRYAEEKDKGENQLERAIAGQPSKRCLFHILGSPW